MGRFYVFAPFILKTARHPITDCRRTSTIWSTRRRGCRYSKIRNIFQTFVQVGKAHTWRAYGRVETVWSFSNLLWLKHQAVFVDKEAAVKRVVGSSELHLGGDTMKLKDQKETKMRRALSFVGFLNYGMKSSYKARVQLEVSKDFPSEPSPWPAGTWCFVSTSFC